MSQPNVETYRRLSDGALRIAIDTLLGEVEAAVAESKRRRADRDRVVRPVERPRLRLVHSADGG